MFSIKAFIDFREIAEESQQSSRPDRISMQQAGPLGRLVLAFQNVTMQYTRLTKKAISDLKSGGDIKKMARFKTQLDRFEAIGGAKAVVPSEGLVFKYNGNIYKFTGAFAPINQITGLMFF